MSPNSAWFMGIATPPRTTAHPPTVSSIFPSTGTPAGGTTVTISGLNFTGATAVHFGSSAAASFTVVNASTITAVSPAESVQTIAAVQNSATVAVSGTNETCTLGSNVTPGNALVLIFGNAQDGTTATSVSGGGVTWVKASEINEASSSIADFQIWYGLNSTGGGGTTVITVGLSGSPGSNVPSINVSEWSGLGALDQAPAGVGSSTGATGSVGVTPSGTGDLFVGALSVNTAVVTGSPGGGFTTLSDGSVGDPAQMAFAYLIATDAAVHTFTQGFTGSDAWVGLAASFSRSASPAVDITVTTPTGTSPAVSADVFTFAAAPGVPNPPTVGTPVIVGATATFPLTAPSNADGMDAYLDGTKVAVLGYPNPMPSSYQFTGLSNGAHTAAFTSFNGSGEGAQSTPVSFTISAPVTSVLLGLYAGSKSSDDSLATTLLVSPLQAYSFYTTGDTWGTIGSYVPSGMSGKTLLLGVNLSPSGVGLSAVAANLATFRSLASNLIGTTTIVRLGWEFGGNWFDWAVGSGNPHGNTPAQFATATGQVINAMKAVNPALKFDLSDNTGSSTLAQLMVVVGSNAALWDYVGGDHYDPGGGVVTQFAPYVQLAHNLGKPLSIGEWGLKDAGDDPAFITNMAQLIQNPVATATRYGWPSYTMGYHSYFSLASYGSDITAFPNSLNAYKAAFG